MIGGVILAICAAAVEFDAVGVDGATVRGELRELSPDRIVLRASSGEDRTLPQSQVVRLSQPGVLPVATEPLGAWIQLTDGGRLLAKSYETYDGIATVGLVGGESVKLPVSAVRAVRLKPMSPEMVSQWEQMVENDPQADCVVIREGSALDYLEGVLGDFGRETFAFTLDGEALTVKRPKAEGLIYFHAKRAEPESPLCSVTDGSGSKLAVASAVVTGDRLQMRTTGGVDLSLPLSAVVGVEFPAQYLTGFKPESIVFTPRVPSSSALAAVVAEFNRPRFDRALEPGLLRLGGREYRRGLAVRSRTEITFLLPEPFGKFTAVAGIDDRVRPSGAVRLVITGDDRTLLDRELSGQDEPLPIALDVTGVVRLKILVDYGADGSETADHLDLCDPRLFP
jgi:hypothetical protein